MNTSCVWYPKISQEVKTSDHNLALKQKIFNRDNAATPSAFAGHRVMGNCSTFQCRYYFLVVWYIPVDEEFSSSKTERIFNLYYWLFGFIHCPVFKTTFRRLELCLHPQVKSIFSFTTVERQLSELISDNLVRIIALNSYPRKKNTIMTLLWCTVLL
jgi:hypothetical protein